MNEVGPTSRLALGGQWWSGCCDDGVVFPPRMRHPALDNRRSDLGAFEIGVFGALALWMLFSNTSDLNLQPFNPNHAVGDWSGVFKGMVFAILAFIGFEASAPLGEEAKNPRRTIPRAVVGSALAIGLFYILCSYAWVFGAGFNNFVTQATGADPWRNLGKVFWGRLDHCVPAIATRRGELERAVNAASGCSTLWRATALRRSRWPRTPFKTPNRDHLDGSSVVLALLFGWKLGAWASRHCDACRTARDSRVHARCAAASCIWGAAASSILAASLGATRWIVLFFFPPTASSTSRRTRSSMRTGRDPVTCSVSS